MITRQMTLFFSCTLSCLALIDLIFAFKGLQNSVPWGPPFALFSGL